MGNRLSTPAPRTGDAGTTGLGDGSRLSQPDPCVSAMGDLDEFNRAGGGSQHQWDRACKSLSPAMHFSGAGVTHHE